MLKSERYIKIIMQTKELGRKIGGIARKKEAEVGTSKQRNVVFCRD
jgi:hypothetical protein